MRFSPKAFHFAARDGICGDGRSYFRIGPNYYDGSWLGDRAALLDERLMRGRY